MKIVGILSFYDESPHWLATAVTGFARVCDSIVAVDGAYALLPGARPCSHPQQAEAVLAAAEAAGVACTVHRPSQVFYGNEVEKRNLTFQLAGVGLTEEDWVLVFDADYHVFKCEPDIVRWELEHTDLHVATYTLLDGMDMLADQDLANYAKTEEFDTEWTARSKDIFRWHPSLLYGPQHWTISKEVKGQRKWLRHATKNIPWLNLDASLVAYHRSQDRVHLRRVVQGEYYKARDMHGIEPLAPDSPTDVLRFEAKV